MQQENHIVNVKKKSLIFDVNCPVRLHFYFSFTFIFTTTKNPKTNEQNKDVLN